MSRGAFAASSLDDSDFEAGSSYVYGNGGTNDRAFGKRPATATSATHPARRDAYGQLVGGDRDRDRDPSSARTGPLGSSIDVGDPYGAAASDSSFSRGRENVPPPFFQAHLYAPSYARATASYFAPPGGTAQLPYQPGIWKSRYS